MTLLPFTPLCMYQVKQNKGFGTKQNFSVASCINYPRAKHAVFLVCRCTLVPPEYWVQILKSFNFRLCCKLTFSNSIKKKKHFKIGMCMKLESFGENLLKTLKLREHIRPQIIPNVFISVQTKELCRNCTIPTRCHKNWPNMRETIKSINWGYVHFINKFSCLGTHRHNHDINEGVKIMETF